MGTAPTNVGRSMSLIVEAYWVVQLLVQFDSFHTVVTQTDRSPGVSLMDRGPGVSLMDRGPGMSVPTGNPHPRMLLVACFQVMLVAGKLHTVTLPVEVLVEWMRRIVAGRSHTAHSHTVHLLAVVQAVLMRNTESLVKVGDNLHTAVKLGEALAGYFDTPIGLHCRTHIVAELVETSAG